MMFDRTEQLLARMFIKKFKNKLFLFSGRLTERRRRVQMLCRMISNQSRPAAAGAMLPAAGAMLTTVGPAVADAGSSRGNHAKSPV